MSTRRILLVSAGILLTAAVLLGVLLAVPYLLPVPAEAADSAQTEAKSMGSIDELNLTSDELKDILRAEIKYVAEIQLGNGAIPDQRLEVTGAGTNLPEVNGIPASTYKTWPSCRTVPYFADAAVLGVLRACAVLDKNDPVRRTGKDVALAYLEWYGSHMNTAETDLNGLAGTVYDYRLYRNPADGTVVEVPLHDFYASNYPNPKDNPYDYDSTDSYAAMYLQLIEEYANLFDSSYLKGKEATVDALVGVLRGTYVSRIGLTGAKPNYMVCYLMDNCEVFNGLESAARLYEAFGKKSKAEDARTFAENVRAAVSDRLFDKSAGLYYYGLFDSGKPVEKADLSKFYPQGSCQLFPVLFGLESPDSDRAISVYNKFTTEFCRDGSNIKNWATGHLKDDTYPWCILLRAVVAMGDYKNAGTFIRAMNTKYVSKGNPTPFYCAEAGHLMTAISSLVEILDNAGNTSEAPSEPTSETESKDPASESSGKTDSQAESKASSEPVSESESKVAESKAESKADSLAESQTASETGSREESETGLNTESDEPVSNADSKPESSADSPASEAETESREPDSEDNSKQNAESKPGSSGSSNGLSLAIGLGSAAALIAAAAAIVAVIVKRKKKAA